MQDHEIVKYKAAIVECLTNKDTYNLEKYLLYGLKEIDETKFNTTIVEIWSQLNDAGRQSEANLFKDTYKKLGGEIYTLSESESNEALAKMSFRAGQFDTAITFYDKCLTDNPTTKEANYGKALAFMQLGKNHEAYHCLKQEIAINPDFAPAYNNIATLLWTSGMYENAVDSLTTAIELDPNFFDALYNKAFFLESIGDFNAAKETYIKYLALQPNDNEAIESLTKIQNSEIKMLTGDWKLGWALTLHTVSSKKIDDEHFDTIRTEVGEMLFQLKYRNDRAQLAPLSELVIQFLQTIRLSTSLAAIIPIPPSNTSRDFQPVYELAQIIGRKLYLNVDFDYLLKTRDTAQLKSIEDQVSRSEVLRDVFTVNDRRYEGKDILLFDDLYRSGETLHAATQALVDGGNVDNVYVVTLTKTRTKK
jgi:predicted amidophosphoribosyltransferase/lipoprotein NlpI